jgi:hypothetical protein
MSRDEPFVTPVNGKDFVVVPYTLRCNDILLIEDRHFSTVDFAQQLKDEFDQLYEEAATRRRMTISRARSRPDALVFMIALIQKISSLNSSESCARPRSFRPALEGDAPRRAACQGRERSNTLSSERAAVRARLALGRNNPPKTCRGSIASIRSNDDE